MEEGLQVDRVVEHLDVQLVKPGDRVIGSLPVDMVATLNAKGVRYFHLVLPMPHNMRGQHMSSDLMRSLGAKIQEYFARKV
jgi:CRISPR-associated protein Csx16